MIDLDRPFREAEQIPVTDLWPGIVTRTPGPPPSPSRGHRLTTIIVALIIAAVGVGLSLRALSRETKQPATPSPSIDERWVTSTSRITGSQAVATADGNVYTMSHAGSDQIVRAFDTNGRRMWLSRSSTEGAGPGGIAADGTGVYVAGRTLRRYTLDGEEVWAKPVLTTERPYGTLIAMDGSGIYVYSSTGSLQKFDRDGGLLWSIDVGSSVESGPFDALIAAPTGGVYMAQASEHGKPSCPHCSSRFDYRLLHVDADGNEMWRTLLKVGTYTPSIRLAPEPSGMFVLANGEACAYWPPYSRPPYSQHPFGRGAGHEGDGCVFKLDTQGNTASGWPVALSGGDYPHGPYWYGGLVPEAGGVLVVGGPADVSSADPLAVDALDTGGQTTWRGTVDLGTRPGYLDAIATDGRDLVIVGWSKKRARGPATAYVASLRVNGFGETGG